MSGDPVLWLALYLAINHPRKADKIIHCLRRMGA